MTDRQIVGLGGFGDNPTQTVLLYRHILGLTGEKCPRVLLIPTAVGDSPPWILTFYERCVGIANVNHLRVYPYPPENMREFVLSHDAISIAAGNTANALALWRLHGIDEVLREAWERGIVLFGASAGMICWFEAGVTDSFGPTLVGMRDGLGFLAGSACPHYDEEEERRPVYRQLVDGDFPEGIAADNGVGLHYLGTELHDIVTCRDGASAYRVTTRGEERLNARLIAG